MFFTHVSRGYPRALLDDFTAAKAAFPGNPLIKCILEALLFSRKGLQMDPVQFMPQLLGRLEDNEYVKCDVAYFHGIVHRSSRQEKDRLEHTNDLKGARTVDMVTVVTIAKDNKFRVWDRSRDKKSATDRQAKSSN
ncbi:hypothetical protein DPMN_003558 [Dreissena polymorpha]|uniref:Uncharacterized protein n=1 Tax=Dreissena polymorpha TaxID=45954 RepID=A0A9D4ML69_DREPO|nr:hypothetical protein DPMN_003558 [Dreissena polymorpha]